MNPENTENPKRNPSPVIGVGTLSINQRARELVMEALTTNRLSYGPMTRRLESQFAQLHGCRFGVMSNSGTSALQIALQAMKELHGWKDGDEVIVPAVTFVATPNVVYHNRLHPVLVDVERTYYGIDPALIEAKITPRTRAIIPVHLFGQAADMDPIREIARKHQLKIIEDSCETMFASYKGKPVGSLGDIGCFSTYVAHLLVTGVGGLNTTNNPEYAVRLHSLLNHGRDSIYISIDDDKNKAFDELKMIIARRFKFVSLGHSFRATEMEAALGLAQLETWESMIAARRSNAAHLTRQLAHLANDLQVPAIRPGAEHSFMMYPIVLKNEPKEKLVNFLEQHGVGTRDMLPLTNQPAHQAVFGWKEEDYPAAQWINQNGFYIGCHHDLSPSDMDYIVELFERYFQRQPALAAEKAALILTTRNSRAILEGILDEMPRELFDRVMAIDDHSSDGTVDLLKQHGIEVVPRGSQTLFKMLTDRSLDIRQEHLVLFPVDGRHNANDIGRLLLHLRRGNDMVVASRFLSGGSRESKTLSVRYRSTGNRMFTTAANLFFYGNLTDTFGPFRAIRKRRLEEARVEGEGLPGFYQLSIESMKRGWKTAEIATVEVLNPYGPADVARIAASLAPITWVLVREWWKNSGKGS